MELKAGSSRRQDLDATEGSPLAKGTPRHDVVATGHQRNAPWENLTQANLCQPCNYQTCGITRL